MPAVIRTMIVDQRQVLDRGEILGEEWILINLGAATSTPEDTIAWLAKRRLLNHSSVCNNCQSQRTFVMDNSRGDTFVWRCPKCKTKESIRIGKINFKK